MLVSDYTNVTLYQVGTGLPTSADQTLARPLFTAGPHNTVSSVLWSDPNTAFIVQVYDGTTQSHISKWQNVSSVWTFQYDFGHLSGSDSGYDLITGCTDGQGNFYLVTDEPSYWHRHFWWRWLIQEVPAIMLLT